MKLPVDHLARLAQLALTDDELQALASELEAILASFATLDELDLDGVEPTAHPLPVAPTLRPDAVEPPLARAEALAGAPEHDGASIIVPRAVP